MTAREKVLQLLKGSDSAKPVSFSALVQKSGLRGDVVATVLDDLCDERMINRAYITQGSLTKLCVWQTSISPKIRFGQYVPEPQPTSNRKPEVVIVATKTEEKQMEQKVNRAQIMLGLLKKNGTATGKELVAASGASSVKPYLEGYFNRGLIVSEGRHSDKVYSLAPGVKPEDLVSAPRKRATPASAATSPVEVTPPSPAPAPVPAAVEERVQAEVPPLAPTMAPIEIPPVSSVPATITLSINDLPSNFPRSAPIAPVQPTAAPRFRVAITSDQTIMLFGLSLEPIELDREQAKTLAEFVSDKGEILCV